MWEHRTTIDGAADILTCRTIRSFKCENKSFEFFVGYF